MSLFSCSICGQYGATYVGYTDEQGNPMGEAVHPFCAAKQEIDYGYRKERRTYKPKDGVGGSGLPKRPQGTLPKLSGTKNILPNNLGKLVQRVFHPKAPRLRSRPGV